MYSVFVFCPASSSPHERSISMENHGISRRQLAKLGLGMATAAGFMFVPGAHAITTHLEESDDHANDFAASVSKAYSFLNTMMDAYAQGDTLRLSQSYTDQQGLQTTGFVYDNSLVINAHLLRGRSDDIARAVVLGKALLHAQQVDAIGDGRVRQAYFVD